MANRQWHARLTQGISVRAAAFEAIVLAGGFGTRITSVVPDRPKVMADVGGRPFLEFLLNRLARQEFARVVLATGYMHAFLEAHFGNRWDGMDVLYSLEDKPLGTGGAVWKALGKVASDIVFVFNGDTFFDVDLLALSACHRTSGADVTAALKPMRDFDRYGAVDLQDGRIIEFHEKRQVDHGLINGGVYAVGSGLPAKFQMPEKFSLETDFLEKKVTEAIIGGYVSDGYFIDIGIPDDYARAQRELPGLP